MSEKGQVIWGYCRTYYLKSTFKCALHTHTHTYLGLGRHITTIIAAKAMEASKNVKLFLYSRMRMHFFCFLLRAFLVWNSFNALSICVFGAKPKRVNPNYYSFNVFTHNGNSRIWILFAIICLQTHFFAFRIHVPVSWALFFISYYNSWYYCCERMFLLYILWCAQSNFCQWCDCNFVFYKCGPFVFHSER